MVLGDNESRREQFLRHVGDAVASEIDDGVDDRRMADWLRQAADHVEVYGREDAIETTFGEEDRD